MVAQVVGLFDGSDGGLFCVEMAKKFATVGVLRRLETSLGDIIEGS